MKIDIKANSLRSVFPGNILSELNDQDAPISDQFLDEPTQRYLHTAVEQQRQELPRPPISPRSAPHILNAAHQFNLGEDVEREAAAAIEFTCNNVMNHVQAALPFDERSTRHAAVVKRAASFIVERFHDVRCTAGWLACMSDPQDAATICKALCEAQVAACARGAFFKAHAELAQLILKAATPEQRVILAPWLLAAGGQGEHAVRADVRRAFKQLRDALGAKPSHAPLVFAAARSLQTWFSQVAATAWSHQDIYGDIRLQQLLNDDVLNFATGAQPVKLSSPTSATKKSLDPANGLAEALMDAAIAPARKSTDLKKLLEAYHRLPVKEREGLLQHHAWVERLCSQQPGLLGKMLNGVSNETRKSVLKYVASGCSIALLAEWPQLYLEADIPPPKSLTGLHGRFSEEVPRSDEERAAHHERLLAGLAAVASLYEAHGKPVPKSLVEEYVNNIALYAGLEGLRAAGEIWKFDLELEVRKNKSVLLQNTFVAAAPEDYKNFSPDRIAGLWERVATGYIGGVAPAFPLAKHASVDQLKALFNLATPDIKARARLFLGSLGRPEVTDFILATSDVGQLARVLCLWHSRNTVLDSVNPTRYPDVFQRLLRAAQPPIYTRAPAGIVAQVLSTEDPSMLLLTAERLQPTVQDWWSALEFASKVSPVMVQAAAQCMANAPAEAIPDISAYERREQWSNLDSPIGRAHLLEQRPVEFKTDQPMGTYGLTMLADYAPQLKHLECGTLTPAAAALLPRLKELRKLTFSVDSSDFDMGQLVRLPNLEKIAVNATCDGAAGWAELARLPQLRKIKLIKHDADDVVDELINEGLTDKLDLSQAVLSYEAYGRAFLAMVDNVAWERLPQRPEHEATNDGHASSVSSDDDEP